MKKTLYLLVFFQTIAFGQKIEFDIHNTSLDQYIQNELKLGNEQIPATSHYVSMNGDAQPLQFIKKNKIIPDLISYYFFKEKDSTMSFVLYEWDVYNFEKNANNKKTKKFQNALIKKYTALKEEITLKFGQAKIKENNANTNKLNTTNNFYENSKWNLNDSTEIELYIAVSNSYEKNEFVTKNPTHRIRLYIRNTKEEEIIKPTLDEYKINNLEEVSLKFLSELKIKNFQKSKTFLSKVIYEQVSEEQLQILSENINFERELNLFYTGFYMEYNGKAYPQLQFKYSDDQSKVPTEIINILFDEDDKIIGIQPLKK